MLNECKRNLFPADEKASKIKKKESRDGSPLNTSGSSITEEIFNTALSNLEFLSDEDSTEGTTQPPSIGLISSDISQAPAIVGLPTTSLNLQRKGSMYCPETTTPVVEI